MPKNMGQQVIHHVACDLGRHRIEMLLTHFVAGGFAVDRCVCLGSR
jgi:hypothetical protein